MDSVSGGVFLAVSVQEHRRRGVRKNAANLFTEEDVAAKFGALYNAFKFGAPPHAGMAPGVDRMIMLLTGEESIGTGA